MISNRALQNFRHFMSPKGAYDAMPRLSRNGIPLRDFEPGGAYDGPVVGQSLTDFKAFLSANLPPTAVVQASLLLKNLLDILDIDDDGDLNPSLAGDMAADEARRFSRPLSGLGSRPRREGSSIRTASAEAEFRKQFPNAPTLR